MKTNSIDIHRFWILLLLLLLFSCTNKRQRNEIEQSTNLAAEIPSSIDESYQAALKQQMEGLNSMESEAEEARKKAKEHEELQWLQGTWEWRGMLHIYGSQYKRVSCKLTIDGDYITSYGDGEILAQGKINDIDMDEEIIHFGNDSYLAFNKESKKLYTGKRSEGTCFRKVSNSVSSSGYGSYRSSKSNNSEHRLMSELDELNEEGRHLVDEIYKYYRTGQAGPGTIQAVFRLKQIQDEKISLAQRMGDRELEAICRQQKAQTLAALKQIGF